MTGCGSSCEQSSLICSFSICPPNAKWDQLANTFCRYIIYANFRLTYDNNGPEQLFRHEVNQSSNEQEIQLILRRWWSGSHKSFHWNCRIIFGLKSQPTRCVCVCVCYVCCLVLVVFPAYFGYFAPTPNPVARARPKARPKPGERVPKQPSPDNKSRGKGKQRKCLQTRKTKKNEQNSLRMEVEKAKTLQTNEKNFHFHEKRLRKVDVVDGYVFGFVFLR